MASQSFVDGQAISVLAPQNLEIGSSQLQNSNSVASGDFNGDGKLDLCILSSASPGIQLTIELGNGHESFSAKEGLVLPGNGYGLVAGDFNRDNRLDVALVIENDSAATFVVLPGNGDGTFGSPIQTSFLLSPGTQPIVIVSDLNDDGVFDAVVDKFVLLGVGDGRFRVASMLTGSALVAADVDQDGVMDLITSYYTDTNILLGRGDGTFSAPLTLPKISQYPNVNFTNAITGDFDGDGITDLVQSGGGRTLISLGLGKGNFQQFRQILDSAGSLAAVDLNNDGKLDLVVGNTVLRGNGNGIFGPAMRLTTRFQSCFPTCAPSVIQVLATDLNSDTLPDIVLAYRYALGSLSSVSLVGVYINDSPGDGILVPAVSAATGSSQVTANSIVSAFGMNMAPTVASAPDINMPPTELGGIRLHIGDVLAPLFYVSPTQINYLLPATTSGTYNFSIERVGTPFEEKGFAVSPGGLTIGLFTVDGKVAAATAVRVAPDGSQTAIPIFSCSNSGCQPVPIDDSGDPIYLSLYGVGFSGPIIPGFPTGPTPVPTCGGTPTTYFGTQGIIPGLSQINWRLPAHLASGTYQFACSVGDPLNPLAFSNPVSLLIK